MRFLARVEHDTVTAVLAGRDVTEPLESVSFNGRDELTRAILRFAASAREHGARKGDVVLGATILQRRRLMELPGVRSTVLRDLVQLQQKRFFRRNGYPLVTDARWERSEPGGERHAVAVAAEEAVVEAVIEGITQAGLEIGRVGDEAGLFQLLPKATIAGRHERLWRQTRLLLIASLALLSATGVAHWTRLRGVEKTLDSRLAQLSPALIGIREARRRLAEAESQVALVDQASGERASMRARLSRVLLSLPDSAYLTSLTLDQSGFASLSGSARATATVVAALEQRAGLSNVRIEGIPLIDGNAGRRWERFNIQAGVEQTIGFR